MNKFIITSLLFFTLVFNFSHTASASCSTPDDSYTYLTKTLLTSPSSTITISDIPAKDYLRLIVYIPSKSASVYEKLTFNSDTSNNYSFRVNRSNTESGTNTQPSIGLTGATNSIGSYLTIEILNKLDLPKFLSYNGLSHDGSASSTVVNLNGHAVWSNTSSQISSLTYSTTTTDTFASGSYIEVYGRNQTPCEFVASGGSGGLAVGSTIDTPLVTGSLDSNNDFNWGLTDQGWDFINFILLGFLLAFGTLGFLASFSIGRSLVRKT